jgi:hypothetical protein
LETGWATISEIISNLYHMPRIIVQYIQKDQLIKTIVIAQKPFCLHTSNNCFY